MIILNKKITDHDEAMFRIYEDLKECDFIKGKNLSKELKLEDLTSIIASLNAKGK